MPIYAYRCEACGFAKDVLQKMSDAQLTVCPTCHQESFKKQVTAAGFQLKGTGWYVTDFRGGAATGKSATGASEDGGSAAATDSAAATTPAAAATSTTTPAPVNSAPASTPASTSASTTTASKTSSSTAT